MGCIVLHLLADMQAVLMQQADSLMSSLLEPASFIDIFVTFLTPSHSQMHLATVQ
jgi:hypothetical protein